MGACCSSPDSKLLDHATVELQSFDAVESLDSRITPDTPLREGYLTKEASPGSVLSRGRLQFFTLSSYVLEWSEHKGSPIRGHMALHAAVLSRSGDTLQLVRRGETLVLRGSDLDGIRIRKRAAALVKLVKRN